MNEKKSNAPIIAIVVVVALALLFVPCLLGALFLGGMFMYKSGDAPESAPTELNAPDISGPAEGESSPPSQPDPLPKD